MNGALLNWGYNSNTGSHLLDITPGSANQQNDAALLVGRTFSDTQNGIHITPVARRASPPSMDVVVKLGTFPGNSPPVASLSASASTVLRNAPVTITATASDANGDALAYGWEFDDGTLAPSAAAVTRSWTTAGSKVVRCVVSDMVGGTTAASITITVTATDDVHGQRHGDHRRAAAGGRGGERRHAQRDHQHVGRLHDRRRAQRDVHAHAEPGGLHVRSYQPARSR